MRILFVRHGNPNYELDVLTELGHKQAEACAERLAKEGIERIFSSTCGRALETAAHTAEKYGLEVEHCDFIREIDWSSKDGTPIYLDGQPWFCSIEYIKQNRSLLDFDWENDPLFSKSHTAEGFSKVASGLDELLEALGFKREGYFYRVMKPKHKTVAIFCHGGAFAAAYSHLFNLPAPFVFRSVPLNQSGVVEITIGGNEGELASPALGTSYGIMHLADAGIEITS